MHDLREFIGAVVEIVARHRLGRPGEYCRWLKQDQKQSRDLSLNPYGCADAANILYTIGEFPRNPEERAGWVAVLRGLQDPKSGMFREATHHEIHTTAHCLAALELFDARPEHSLSALSAYREPAAMEQFLDGLDWRGDPWSQSHRGAGLYAALVLNGEVDRAWQERYFAWLAVNFDPETGFLRRGCIGPVKTGNIASIFPHLAGTFHYLFNLEYGRQPLRHHRAMVDTCLQIFAEKSDPLGGRVGFAEIDWVFCLNRALRQSGHRHEDCRRALSEFATGYVSYLCGLDPATDEGLNDLHALFGAVCCLAELQAALPGELKTDRPLKLVLDRRPFI